MIQEVDYFERGDMCDFYRDDKGKVLVPLHWALGFDLFTHYGYNISVEPKIIIDDYPAQPKYEGDFVFPKDKNFSLGNLVKRNMTIMMMNLFASGVARAMNRIKNLLGGIDLVVPVALKDFYDDDEQDSFYNIDTIDAMLRDIVSSVILTSYLPGSQFHQQSGSKKTSVLHGLHVLDGNMSIQEYRRSASHGKDGTVYTNPTSYNIGSKSAMIVLPYLEGVCMRMNVIMDMIFEQEMWHHFTNRTRATALHKETIAKIGMQMVQDPRFGVEFVKDPQLEGVSYEGTSAKMVTKIMNDFVRKHNLPVRTEKLSVLDNKKIETMKIDPITCLSL